MTLPLDNAPSQAIFLCHSSELHERAEAVPFDLVYCGRNARGFAIRFEGQVHAYLNQCAHVPMEMDYQPNQFFDTSGQWLICATHGALYSPETGQCRGGPCRSGLIKIAISERDACIYWHTAPHLKPLAF